MVVRGLPGPDQTMLVQMLGGLQTLQADDALLASSDLGLTMEQAGDMVEEIRLAHETGDCGRLQELYGDALAKLMERLPKKTGATSPTLFAPEMETMRQAAAAIGGTSELEKYPLVDLIDLAQQMEATGWPVDEGLAHEIGIRIRNDPNIAFEILGPELKGGQAFGHLLVRAAMQGLCKNAKRGISAGVLSFFSGLADFKPALFEDAYMPDIMEAVKWATQMAESFGAEPFYRYDILTKLADMRPELLRGHMPELQALAEVSSDAKIALEYLGDADNLESNLMMLAEASPDMAPRIASSLLDRALRGDPQTRAFVRSEIMERTGFFNETKNPRLNEFVRHEVGGGDYNLAMELIVYTKGRLELAMQALSGLSEAAKADDAAVRILEYVAWLDSGFASQAVFGLAEAAKSNSDAARALKGVAGEMSARLKGAMQEIREAVRAGKNPGWPLRRIAAIAYDLVGQAMVGLSRATRRIERNDTP